METNCPGCGRTLATESRQARVTSADCADCGTHLSFIEPSAAAEGAAAPAGSASPAEGMPAAGAEPSVPIACPQCEGPLAVEPTPTGDIAAACPSCGAHLTYRLERPRARLQEEGPAREGDERGPRREGAFGRPASRPCRECGGALSFTTGPDGRVTGECGSCGNRFTLPPRREDRDRGRPGGFQGGRRPYTPRYGSRSGWGGRDRSDRPSPRGPRSYGRGRPREGGDEGERPRRRRPRAE